MSGESITNRAQEVLDETALSAFVDSLVEIENRESEDIFEKIDARLLEIENEVVRKLRQPRLFALICERAYNLIKNPVNKAIVGLGIINGLRRVNDEESVAAAKQWFDEIRRQIDALPSGSPDRCIKFWKYQAGVFMSKQGFYRDAINLETENSSDESMAQPERAVSQYLTLVYRVWQAFVDGDLVTIADTIHNLEAGLSTLQNSIKESKFKTTWGGVAGPLHLLQARLLSGASSDKEWDELLQTMKANEKEFGAQSKAWAEVFTALGDIEKLTMLSQKAAGNTDTEDSRIAACLLVARDHAVNGRIAEAKAMYEQVEPVPNGHMIATIAARELAALGS